MRNVTAIALFSITIAAIALLWQHAFWATALAEVGIFSLAAIWLTAYLAGREELEGGFVLIPLAGAALWPVVQILAGSTIYAWGTSVAALYWGTGAAVVFVGLQIFRDAGIRRGYLRAVVVAGLALAIIAPLQRYTADGRIFWLFDAGNSSVAMGPFLYVNQYAAFIELLLPIALTGVFSDRGGWRTFHWVASAVMYASVFAAVSRTGFILTTIEVLVVPLLAARRTGIPARRLLVPGAIFLGVLIALGLAVGPERLVAKMQQKNPFAGRQEFVESSLRMIPDRPLMGVGMGNWPTAYLAYATFDNGYFANQAHNDWVQWAVEGGLPFFLLLLSVAVWSFRAAFRTGWGIGVALVFVQCLVDYPITKVGLAIVFFTLMAAIACPDGTYDGNRSQATQRR